MMRAVLLIGASALLAGCQSYNPFAVFGPPTVPTPKNSQSPYYPPAAATQTASSLSSAPSTRQSVSAEGSPSFSTLSSTAVADAADREHIRIVENPTPTRTATAPLRDQQPSGTAKPPMNAPPGTSPQSRLRTDPAVVPAGYQQPLPAFSEPPKASGTWRAR